MRVRPRHARENARGAALAYGAPMLAACYNSALETFLSPTAEAVVTRFRAVLIMAVSAPLGAVAAVSLRVADSRWFLVGLVGGGAMLGAAVAVDILDFVSRLHALRAELREQLRGEVKAAVAIAIESVHERLDVIEAKLVGIGRQSYTGGADGTGSGRAVKP